MSSFIEAQAPGKLIVLGEHIVVSGAPAMALALKKYTRVRLELIDESADESLDTISSIFTNRSQWGPFLLDSLELPSHYFWAKEMLREMKPLTFQNALRWLIRSEIEPGHGMGSSAAAICASFSALSTLFQKQIDKSQSWPFLTRIESICHGKSSGIDIATSLQGGFLKFQSGEFLSLPPISLENWYLLDSGRPQQSTKECVAHSQEVLAKNPSLLAEMKQTAESFIKKASQLSFEEISRYIRHWHQLQKRLGVVPQSAYRLISHIEGRGASAKVCGAGALAGEGAGLILVLALPGVAHILRKEGLKLEPVEVDNEGSCVTFIG